MRYKVRVCAVNEAGESRPNITNAFAPKQKLVLPTVELDLKAQDGLSGKHALLTFQGT